MIDAVSGFPGVRRHWRLDPDVVQLNHGGFGAVPIGLQQEQQRWRDLIERNPTDFFTRRITGALAEARQELATFLGADPDGIVFVINATAGVQTVLAGLELAAGDEVLTTDHCYGGVRRQLDALADRTGATVTVATIPLPVGSDQEVLDAVLAAVTGRTRVLVVDHVASPSGLVFPVEQLAAACRDRGIVTVVDGAHAPAMLPLHVDRLGVDYWTGNLHKWLCAPKSGGVLWAAPPHRDRLRPLVPSHGYTEGFQAAFDWTGTHDPSPVLTAPAAVGFFDKLGLSDVRAHNHALAGYGARVVAEALGTSVPVADALAGSLRVAWLPRPLAPEVARAVERRLLEEHRIEVPLMTRGGDAEFVRVSAQVYNERADYDRLARALPRVLKEAGLAEIG